MQIKQLSDDFSVAPQMSPNEVEVVAQQGFKTIICNRPDKEDPSQPDHALIQQEAEKKGVTFYYLPVISGSMTDENVTEFHKILQECPKPALAYCRSGTRCTNLWSLSQKG